MKDPKRRRGRGGHEWNDGERNKDGDGEKTLDWVNLLKEKGNARMDGANKMPHSERFRVPLSLSPPSFSSLSPSLTVSDTHSCGWNGVREERGRGLRGRESQGKELNGWTCQHSPPSLPLSFPLSISPSLTQSGADRENEA